MTKVYTVWYSPPGEDNTKGNQVVSLKDYKALQEFSVEIDIKWKMQVLIVEQELKAAQERIAELEQQLAEVVALHAKVSSQNIELTGKMEQLFASVNRDLHNFPAIFLDWFDDKGRSK